MTQDTQEIVVAANGQVHVAPVGSTAPTDATSALDAAWVDLGLVDEDGAMFRDSKTLEVIRSWQLFYPGRRVVTERDLSVQLNLQQWNVDTVPFALGGGDITEPTPGVFAYDPPEPEVLDERALCLTWQDGVEAFRLYVKRGMVTEPVESKLVRSAEALLPITFSIVGVATEKPWRLFSNVTALNPTP